MAGLDDAGVDGPTATSWDLLAGDLVKSVTLTGGGVRSSRPSASRTDRLEPGVLGAQAPLLEDLALNMWTWDSGERRARVAPDARVADVQQVVVVGREQRVEVDAFSAGAEHRRDLPVARRALQDQLANPSCFANPVARSRRRF